MAKLTLAAIAASCVEVEVEIAGVRLRARPLSAQQMALVMAAMPEQAKPDEKLGEMDPVYKREKAEWLERLKCCTVAAAVMLADAGQLDGAVWPETIGKTGQWLGHARHTEIAAAFEAVTRPYAAAGASTPAEAAEKN